jgi:hypothetical protein
MCMLQTSTKQLCVTHVHKHIHAYKYTFIRDYSRLVKKSKLLYDRRSVGQSVLVSSTSCLNSIFNYFKIRFNTIVLSTLMSFHRLPLWTFLDQNFVAFFFSFSYSCCRAFQWMPISLRIQEVQGSNLGEVTRYHDCRQAFLIPTRQMPG